jgi:hypothetical protein
MWEAVALTLAGAAGNSIGKVLQKKGTLILPPLSFKLKVRAPLPSLFRSRVAHADVLPFCAVLRCVQVIRRYALNTLWISGFLLDMCGAALMLTALSQAPVRRVLPLSPSFLARFSASLRSYWIN